MLDVFQMRIDGDSTGCFAAVFTGLCEEIIAQERQAKGRFLPKMV